MVASMKKVASMKRVAELKLFASHFSRLMKPQAAHCSHDGEGWAATGVLQGSARFGMLANS